MLRLWLFSTAKQKLRLIRSCSEDTTVFAFIVVISLITLDVTYIRHFVSLVWHWKKCSFGFTQAMGGECL